MQLAAFLCVICVICGRITRKRTQSIYKQGNPNISPADHADLRRQPPNNNNPNNHTTNTTCLSLRNNAACCIPYLRDLRYLRENNTQEDSINLRENIHARGLKLYTNKETPIYLPLITQIYADKTQIATTSFPCGGNNPSLARTAFQQNKCRSVESLTFNHLGLI